MLNHRTFSNNKGLVKNFERLNHSTYSNNRELVKIFTKLNPNILISRNRESGKAEMRKNRMKGRMIKGSP
jgi:hypothetical protein